MSTQPSPEAKTDPTAQKPRVMVADDSRVMRLAVKKILGADFDLVQAETGLQAWEQLCQDPTIQALVSDIEMPGLDGYELICRIRAADDERLRDLPIITITGAEDEVTKQRAFACGATDFITKPLDAIQLLARVQAYARYDQTTRELSEQTATLEEQSIADLLTGLPSRRYLMQRGEQDVAYARRHGNDLALIRVDIDGFKQHYRILGDEGSDRLLGWVAKMLIDNARTEDTVARIAGAEFAVHANGIGMEEATIICDRVRSAVVRKPFVDGNHSITVTLSMGLASLGQDRAGSLDSLLRLATQRALQARSDGGNRVCSSIPGQSLAEMEEVTLGAPEAGPVIDEVSMGLEVSAPAATPPVDAMGDVVLASEASIDETIPGLDSIEEPVAESIEISAEMLEPVAANEASQPLDIHGSSSADNNVAIEDRLELPESSPSPPVVDLISVDKALSLLAQGHEKLLMPYLDGLMKQLRPLLDLHQRHRR